MKTIPIIPCLDFGQELFARDVQFIHGVIQALGKAFLEFLLRVAEHGGVVRMHRDVSQVVEVGKERDMRKLGDASDKHKPL